MPLATTATTLTTVIDGRPHLLGARCETCATHTFPAGGTCPRCGGAMSDVALPNTGTVWSWTVQRIAPKLPYNGPSPFVPFAVGYVDLGHVKVESPLAGHPVDAWRIGETVELAVGGSVTSALGESHLAFWFEAKEQAA
jgi:uncharacterized protein